MFNTRARKDLACLKADFAESKAVLSLFESESGVGLWQCKLHQGDLTHPKSVLRWSDGMRKIFGYSNEADYPNTAEAWADKLHPDDKAATLDAFAAHVTDKTGRTPFDAEYRYRMKDGSYRWFNGRGGSVRGADGIAIRCCGSIVDIHDRKVTQLHQEELARKQACMVEAIASGLRQLAGGNLMVRIEAEVSAEYQQVKADFNSAAAELAKVLQSVASSTQALRSGSTEISAAADDLSRRTEQQAASLEETAAALDEITATVKKTADGAGHARQVVLSAKTDAEHSGDVVSQAVQAMTAIEKSSQQVSQIIGVIDEIAFQTNLLALNAGVEAARAGEAGRGFAVVASEVRALAQRSAEAAKEIKALISTSTGQVSAGVSLVDETGTSLSRIVKHVAEINTIMSEISSCTQEQATGLNQVNTAVNQMDQVTQRNAAMVEQSTAASHTLVKEAEQLALVVDRFQLGQAAATATAPRRAPPARPAKRPQPTTTMLKPVGRGGAAMKPDAATEAGWEEF